MKNNVTVYLSYAVHVESSSEGLKLGQIVRFNPVIIYKGKSDVEKDCAKNKVIGVQSQCKLA